MAGLYFKFNADYDNVARIRQEIDKLTAKIKELDGSANGDEIEKYQKTLSLLEKEFRRSVREASKAGKEFEKTGDAIETMNGISTKFIATIGGLAMLKNLAGSIVQVRGEFQQLEIAFGTMLQSADKAKKLMSELTYTAAHTPFDLQGIAGAAKQLLAYGSAADKVNSEIVMLGNVAAGVGSSIGDIAYLYGTLRTQGRAYLMDIRQFAGRGIPIYEELSKQLGVSRDEVNKLVSAGKVGFPEIEKCFQSMTAEGGKFYNLMEAQSKSLTGQISNLQDAWDMMLNEMGQNTEGIANTVISTLSSLVENYDKVLKVISSLVVAYGVLKTALIIQTVRQGKEIMVSKALRVEFLKLAKNGVVLSNSQKFLAVMTGGLSLKFRELWAVIAANPLGAVLSVITLVGGALWAFSGSADEAEQAVADFEDRTDRQIGKLEILKSTLENADKTSNTYKNTIDEVNKMCKDYGVTLLNENATLDEQKKKYEELKGAIKAANAEKTASTLKENAGATLTERNSKDIEAYIKQLSKAQTMYVTNGQQVWVGEEKVKRNAQTLGSLIGSEVLNAITTNIGKGDEVINAELEKVRENVKKTLQSSGYSQNAIDAVLKYRGAFDTLTESIKSNVEKNKESIRLAEDYEKANAKDIQAMHDRERATKLSTMSTRQLNNELEKMKTEFAKIGVHITIKADVQISDSYKKQYDSLSKVNLANNIRAIETAMLNVKNNPKLKKMSVKLNSGRIDASGTQQQILQQLTDQMQMQQMLLGDKNDRETNVGDEYAKALKDYKAKKARYEKAQTKMKSGVTKDTSADMKEMKEEYETAEKKLKELGGDVNKKSKSGSKVGKGSKFDAKQAQYDIDKINESFNKSIKDFNDKAKQTLAGGRLSAMKDGTDKDIAQIKAQNEQELKAYDEEIEKFIENMKKNDLDKWLKGGKDRKAYNFKPTKTDDEYRKELFAQSPELESNYIELRAQSQARLNEELRKIQEEKMKADYDYLIQYGELTEKRVALEKRYNLELSQAQDERERKILTKEYEKSMKDLKLETLKSDDAYIEAFEDLSQVSNDTLTRLIKKFEEAKSAQKDLSPTELKEYVDTIRQMRDELDNRDPFTALKDSIVKAKQARQEYEDANEQYNKTGTIFTGRMVISQGTGTDLEGNKVDEVVPEILKGEEAIKFLEKAYNKTIKTSQKVKKNIISNAEAFGKLFSSIQEVGGALEGVAGEIVTTIAGIGSLVQTTITSFSNVSSEASTAIQTIEKASVILTAISVAFQLANKIINMFDNAKQKKIEQVQEKIDNLTKAYNKLDKAVGNAYSKEATNLIKQEEANLRMQKMLIEQQRELEKSKKKTDDSKISDYNDKLSDIDEKLDELKDKEIDVIFGQDIKSAIESFADAYVSAWENGENRIRSSKNFVKDVIKNMITEAMKADLTKPMEKIRTMLQGYFSDNIITTAEEAEVAAYASQITKELDEKYAWANKYLKDNNDTTESKGMASMSESTAEELNGRFTALQISGEKISTENVVQTQTLSLLNLKADDISRILSKQKDISDEARTQLANIYIELKGINDNTLAVVKPIANMSKKMDKWDNKIMSL